MPSKVSSQVLVRTKTLAQRNRALYTIFARGIRGTSPDFRPFDDPTQYFPIDGLESEECVEVRNDKVQIMGVYDVRKTISESVPFSPFSGCAFLRTVQVDCMGASW